MRQNSAARIDRVAHRVLEERAEVRLEEAVDPAAIGLEDPAGVGHLGNVASRPRPR